MQLPHQSTSTHPSSFDLKIAETKFSDHPLCDLSELELRSLALHLTRVHCPAGTVLLREGESPLPALMLISNGRVSLHSAHARSAVSSIQQLLGCSLPQRSENENTFVADTVVDNDAASTTSSLISFDLDDDEDEPEDLLKSGDGPAELDSMVRADDSTAMAEQSTGAFLLASVRSSIHSGPLSTDRLDGHGRLSCSHLQHKDDLELLLLEHQCSRLEDRMMHIQAELHGRKLGQGQTEQHEHQCLLRTVRRDLSVLQQRRRMAKNNRLRLRGRHEIDNSKPNPSSSSPRSPSPFTFECVTDVELLMLSPAHWRLLPTSVWEKIDRGTAQGIMTAIFNRLNSNPLRATPVIGQKADLAIVDKIPKHVIMEDRAEAEPQAGRNIATSEGGEDQYSLSYSTSIDQADGLLGSVANDEEHANAVK